MGFAMKKALLALCILALGVGIAAAQTQRPSSEWDKAVDLKPLLPPIIPPLPPPTSVLTPGSVDYGSSSAPISSPGSSSPAPGLRLTIPTR